ncbi:hypothetical protein E2P60_03495 [Candidatus Bathyarchaeota archaeon]|nr:hypothetical protein E2P60_03495 [Candidatus Bathyarchaeota archaeon]
MPILRTVPRFGQENSLVEHVRGESTEENPILRLLDRDALNPSKKKGKDAGDITTWNVCEIIP